MRLLRRAAATVGALGLLVSAPAAQQNPDPSFQSNVEYVVVDVRVSASDGTPKRGLTRDVFRVYEDGIEQQIDAFSVVDLPATPPAVAATAARAITAPDVATNERPVADGIAYLIVIDDESIAASRTLATRHLVREIIDRHLGPNDIAAVVTTGKSLVFQDFTADRVRLKAAVGKMFGGSAGSPTIQRMLGIESRSPPSAGPIATPAAGRDQAIAPALRSQQFIARAAAAMSAMDGRTKAILLITEGSPVETVTDAEGVTFCNESIGAQRRLNSAVPIYPIDPRGLTSLADESIQLADVPTPTLANEVAAARERMWRLAEDTGGFATVGNNLDGAFARIEQHAGFHYSIAYYPKSTRRDGKYRRIEVKVSAPDAKVLARRGYVAPTDRPSRVGASAVSPVLRDALEAMFPLDGLRLAVSAAPFRGKGRDASVALVHEAPGLDATELDVATMAIDEHGSTKATDAKKLQWPAGSAAGARVQENGFRWLSRLTLKPGRYQFRVAGLAAAQRGSVYLDVDVPDFSDGDLTMSGVLLSSAAAFDTPTYKPDPLLADALPGPPTTSRTFATGDNVGVFCEIYDNGRNRSAPVEITFAVDAVDGRRLFAQSEMRPAGEAAAARGVVKFRTGFTVPSVSSGDYLVVVAARRPGASEHAAVRTIPFRVIAD